MLPNMLPSATAPLEKLLTNPSPYKRNSQESDFGPYKRNSVKSKSVNPGKKKRIRLGGKKESKGAIN